MDSTLVSMWCEASVCQILYSSRHVNYLKSCCFGTVRRLICDIICGIFTSSEHNLVFYGSQFTLKWYVAYQCVSSIVGEDLMYNGRKTMFPCRWFICCRVVNYELHWQGLGNTRVRHTNAAKRAPNMWMHHCHVNIRVCTVSILWKFQTNPYQSSWTTSWNNRWWRWNLKNEN